jgi:hypothetical protein
VIPFECPSMGSGLKQVVRGGLVLCLTKALLKKEYWKNTR